MTASVLTPPAAEERTSTMRALEVRFERTEKTFRSGGVARTVLTDVSFAVAPGEVVAILGPSGCGKSTLLRIAAGLETASGGAVSVDGTPVNGIDARCAVAFQEPRLLPWRTLRDNVALGLPRGTGRRAGAAVVDRLLELVGLAGHAGHRPREVSGGMAQRASLARALARTPGVLLLDEPFGALDALTRLKMQDLLLDVHAAEPTTVLLVTHDVDEALQLADGVLVLGRDDAAGPAGVRSVVTVPGARPRDRSSAALAALRGDLLAALGVERAHH
ncbi:ABC transporter ATP-binding protein [Georgenia thermotolerans]|uniref:ATP-binding cassette domain-containing protein n=1 Tax=Georgenia thermotolerans TaxID=527326 RepID=A0A7J5UM11_9MICO|nr:ABC transporter ATP-binding protein [Georgenia thermotolerans]KAE8763144.1 ATP-binding cassette domain-containing protein [Georgenia thermotolerans]